MRLTQGRFEQEALRALANPHRLKIIEMLSGSDKAFTEIQRAVGLEKGSLTYHMKDLVKAGLVANIYERKVESNPRVYSYYALTSFGAFTRDMYRQLKERGPALRQQKIAASAAP